MTAHSTTDINDATMAAAIESLQAVGRLFYQRGWSVGTSSNYSVVLQHDPLQLLITASGKDKGNLQTEDFVLVGEEATPIAPASGKSSAETWLHVVAAGKPGIGSILHTHSVWGTLLSEHFGDQGGFWIEGFEMLKGLEGITTHEHRQWVPIYENTQDIRQLAETVQLELQSPTHPPFHGFLIRKHGLYTWGKDIFAARRHIEIFEFLFECTARKLRY